MHMRGLTGNKVCIIIYVEGLDKRGKVGGCGPDSLSSFPVYNRLGVYIRFDSFDLCPRDSLLQRGF